MLQLDGRYALVTGGASGIGAAVAAALETEGVRVASIDVQSGGPATLQLRADVTDGSSIDDACATLWREFGALHYAFVNAGIAGVGSFLNMPAEEWDRVMNVNLRGAFLSMQRAGRLIRDTGDGGAIVATASSAGILADLGMVHYSVAKMGIRQMVRIAARELGRYGIRVNAVAPGVTNTPMTEPTKDLPGFHDSLRDRTPLGRLGETDDIADAVLALFALKWVTGQTLAADGGITLYSGTDIPGVTPDALDAWFFAR
jgi:NAD(P)-dependent dehydrogenase (short-subunit alcohol dehydrogenase family)